MLAVGVVLRASGTIAEPEVQIPRFHMSSFSTIYRLQYLICVMINHTKEPWGRNMSARYQSQLPTSKIPRHARDTTFGFNVTFKLTQPSETGIKITKLRNRKLSTGHGIGDYVYNFRHLLCNVAITMRLLISMNQFHVFIANMYKRQKGSYRIPQHWSWSSLASGASRGFLLANNTSAQRRP